MQEIADGENAVEGMPRTTLKVGITLLSVDYLGTLGYKYFGAIVFSIFTSALNFTLLVLHDIIEHIYRRLLWKESQVVF